jgi:hypothetical protein
MLGVLQNSDKIVIRPNGVFLFTSPFHIELALGMEFFSTRFVNKQLTIQQGVQTWFAGNSQLYRPAICFPIPSGKLT